MKKLFILLNIIFANLTIVADFLYATEVKELWMKGVASGLFLIIGIINLIYAFKTGYGNKKFIIGMVIGLAICMIADIVLNLYFIGGAILFAIGHVFYFLAYCTIFKFHWKDFIPAICIFIPSVLVITLVPAFDFGGILMELICIMYALIISCMVGKTIANLIRSQTLTNIILVIGSILFFFSDLMLLIDQFSSLPNIFGILCIATYYPAQVLLGYSLFQNTMDENNGKFEKTP